MNFLSRLVLFFTPSVVIIALGSFVWFCHTLNLWALLLFFVAIYGLPLIAYRLHQFAFPLKEGISYINNKEISHWWISSQLQSLYFTFPVLETVLRLIPGLFSFWLRMWGANIGKGVYWTPQIAIADRGLIEVGDNVIFGNWVVLIPHVVKPRKGQLMLYIKKISIGERTFVGGSSRLAPGVKIEKESIIPVNSDIYPNQKINQIEDDQEEKVEIDSQKLTEE